MTRAIDSGRRDIAVFVGPLTTAVLVARLGCRRGLVLALGVAITVPRTLAAQAGDSTSTVDSAVDVAAQTITVAELARHMDALAADSLRGRTAPGPALEAAARYVAAQLRALGLGPWRSHLNNDAIPLNSYTLPGTRARLNLRQSRLELTARLLREGQVVEGLRDEQGQPVQRVVALDFATTARLAADSLATSMLVADPSRRAAPAVVVSGHHTAATLPCDRVERRLLLYVPSAGLDSTARATVLASLTRCAPVLVVAADDADSTTFAARRAAAAATPRVVFEQYMEEVVGARAWVAYAAPRAVAPALQSAGLDLAVLWGDTMPRMQVLPALTISPALVFDPPTEQERAQVSGVYATGFLQGSESENYLVYTASLDGSAPGGSLSGQSSTAASEAATEVSVAALLALAKAFAQPGLRPRHSVLFVATSGARQHFASIQRLNSSFDEAAVLNLTLDAHLGRLRGDTLPVAGLSDFTFARRPAWVAQTHPELGLMVVDGGTVLQSGSDASAFARHGVVSLAFAPARGEPLSPEPLSSGPLSSERRGAADGEPVALRRAISAVRLAFYLGQELANARAWPTWTPAARATWTAGLGR